MGNKGSAQHAAPHIAKGEPVDVLRGGKWKAGKIRSVAADGTVVVVVSLYGKSKDVEVRRKDYAKRLAAYGSRADREAEQHKRKSMRPVRTKVPGAAKAPAPAPGQPADGGEAVAQEVDAKKVVGAVPVAREAAAAAAGPAVDDDGGEVEYLDVLDKSRPMEKGDPMVVPVPSFDVPPPPMGGWRWRPASIKSVRGNIGRVRFLDMETVPPTYDAEGKVDLNDAECVAPYQSKSGADAKMHDFNVGDVLDVEDHFRKKGGRGLGKKWRKCQVTRVERYYIRVTFVGWSRAFDTWMHVLEQKDRLAEFGSMTEQELKRKENQDKHFVESLRREKGLTVVSVEPDGNCLFRAVAHQVYGDVERHEIVRSDCCDYLEKNKERFAPLLETGQFDAYVDNKRELKVWGDDPEVRAMEELYDRPVEVFSATSGSTDPLKLHFVGDLPPDAEMGAYTPIRLSFHGQNHYNSVIPFVTRRPANAKAEAGLEDVSEKAFQAPPLRTKGVIRRHRRVRVKSRRHSTTPGFRVELHGEEDDEDEGKRAT